MKKRLLITSIVMMLVVAVALSTATYAWFTSNATVNATSVSMTAATNSAASIGISWTDSGYGTSIEADGFTGLVFAPAAISDITASKAFDETVWGSATVKDVGGNKTFNTAYNTVITSNDITAASNTDGTNKITYTYGNTTASSSVIYIHNGSTANTLTSVTAKATITGAAQEFIRIAIYRLNDSDYELKGIMMDQYVYTAATGKVADGVTYYDAAGNAIDTSALTVGTSDVPANSFTRAAIAANTNKSAVGNVTTGGTVGTAITAETTGYSINCGGLAVDGDADGGDVMALKVIVWMDGTALNDDTAGSTGKVASIALSFDASRS